MSRIDYYEVLQVSPGAEPEVIEAAYRRLAQKYHPDKAPQADDGSRMRSLNEAYEVLRDRERRREYDQRRASRTDSSPVGERVRKMLEQGMPPGDVIASLVQGGLDLESAAIIVGAVVEGRRRAAAASGDDVEIPARRWRSSLSSIRFGKLASHGGTLLIYVLVILPFVLPFVLPRSCSLSNFGERLEFVNGELFYEDTIEPGEAQKVGELLVRLGYFGEKPSTVQVKRGGASVALRMVVKENAALDRSIDDGFKDLAATVSRECFNGLRVVVYLCNDRLETVRKIE